ncbi:DUF6825 family protein [Oscillatoria sp. FACHB-1406]|uniref:DUF6825 family protein n=1 Tax=Oscillatoria sp. FACHB-1406 TaxID=2692846 RepID=UPI001683BE44|nr:hypothetical protein [Oscillatoria sp. FACHB-1406]MBD2579120.1 hypothetical protein [Oscillatoria sp. FACHB-1406]
MSNPVIHAFFVGKAVAEVLYEKAEDSLSNALSELGRFDAEQRENLRQFSEEVLARAEREIARETGVSTANATSQSNSDLQETIDELRAEIARVRSELTAYRSRSI